MEIYYNHVRFLCFTVVWILPGCPFCWTHRVPLRELQDNTGRKLNDDCFGMMRRNYDAEQKRLETEEISLRQNENIEKFIQKVCKYVDIKELGGYALRELVSAIYVDAPDKSSGKRAQYIHIKHDGQEFIHLDELMKRETV